ncbi:MAG: phosphatidyl-myo-inositol alpha-mannosyltransferase [Acidimicrobiaceae bacterium]
MRRGAEREIHDLGTRVAASGTEVQLLTSTPRGLVQRDRFGAMAVRYIRLPQPAVLARRGLSDVAAFAAIALPLIAATPADLVHAWHYGDGWAAVRARRVRPRPVVLKLTGTVLPERMGHVRIDRRLFREAIEGADEVWCNSPYSRDVMAGFGVEMHVIPAGVDLHRFRPGAGRSDPPTVLCASAPDDPRKRLVDVIDAWPFVLDAVPDARLVLAGGGSAAGRRALIERLPSAAAGSVSVVGDLADDDLVTAYAMASAVVAPGVHEALGLSTIEALACGTPVAGARSGATADLIQPGRTGALFEPVDPADCARAIVETVALAGDPTTVAACRTAAEPFGWDEVVPLVESRWHRLLAR